MEVGAFKSPLNELGLSELGRATYNWGMADMLAQTLLCLCHQIDESSPTAKDLIAPLAIDKKASLLKRRVEAFPAGECRELVTEFALEIARLCEGRNHAIHGFWGWDMNGPEPIAGAYSHKNQDNPLRAEEIETIADRIAVATKKAHRAWMMLTGKGDVEVTYPCQFHFRKKPTEPPEEQSPPP
jgi:hypothetical protein